MLSYTGHIHSYSIWFAIRAFCVCKTADIPGPVQAVRDENELQDEDEETGDQEHPRCLERPPGTHQSGRPSSVFPGLWSHQGVGGGEACSLVRHRASTGLVRRVLTATLGPEATPELHAEDAGGGR